MAKAQGKKITLGTIIGVLLLVGAFIAKQQGWLPRDNEEVPNTDQRTTQNDGGIGDHFRAQRSDVIVTASGVVKKILPDDNEGSRHQKLIVTLSTGHTVLIAHNIDLAPRVPCDEGDLVQFRGEYEWSDQGGVVHWTHHDPAGRHPPGWIEFGGVRYE